MKIVVYLFAQVDRDASGTVELQEVQSALPEIPPEQVAKLFADADRNHDGHLDRQEYTSMVGYPSSKYVMLLRNFISCMKIT